MFLRDSAFPYIACPCPQGSPNGDSGVTVTGTGVANGSSVPSGVGVFVGARVGKGACVGVGCSVLPGKTMVGTEVGRTNVGRTTVGREITTVEGGGVATSIGRTTKLTNPKL